MSRPDRGDPLPGDAWLRRVARAALVAAGVAGSVEVALLLADDRTLRQLNRQYRAVDRPTDVLSFAQDEGDKTLAVPERRTRHLGDVAISVERARRQAQEYGHRFQRELGYLLAHGTLHLAGYDHQADSQQADMRRLEEAALSRCGLARPADDGQ